MGARPASEVAGLSPASVGVFGRSMRHLMTWKPSVRIPEKRNDFIPTLELRQGRTMLMLAQS